MKKLLVSTVLVAGLAASVYGQGFILNNLGNSSLDSTATSGGLVWTNNGTTSGLFDGVNGNIGLQILVGATSSSLSPFATFAGFDGSSAYTGDSAGKFNPFGFSAINGGSPEYPSGINTAAGAAVWIEIQAWYYLGTGGPQTYAAAVSAGDLAGTVLFQNPVSNPGGIPAVPDQSLTGMPALILAAVPEPGTFAIAGLGAALLLALRRRS
jgi:hypothetical protein